MHARRHSLTQQLPDDAALVVGDPEMLVVQIMPGRPAEQLSSLPHARKEALAIPDLLGTKALIGDQATKVAVLAALPGQRVIHLATHGLLNEIKGQNIPGAIALIPLLRPLLSRAGGNQRKTFGQFAE